MTQTNRIKMLILAIYDAAFFSPSHSLTRKIPPKKKTTSIFTDNRDNFVFISIFCSYHMFFMVAVAYRWMHSAAYHFIGSGYIQFDIDHS